MRIMVESLQVTASQLLVRMCSNPQYFKAFYMEQLWLQLLHSFRVHVVEQTSLRIQPTDPYSAVELLVWLETEYLPPQMERDILARVDALGGPSVALSATIKERLRAWITDIRSHVDLRNPDVLTMGPMMARFDAVLTRISAMMDTVQ